MSSRQGYNWMPNHDQWRGRILEHIRRVKPAFGVILTEDFMPISEAWAAHPHAICARVYEIDDGAGNAGRALDADPIAAADDLLARYMAKIAQWRAQAADAGVPFPDAEHLYISAWNEPNQHTSYAKIVQGNLRLLTRATAVNVRVLAIKLGIGHPSGLKADGSVDWTDFEHDALEQAINDGGHAVGLHAYFQAEGPNHNWIDETGKLREDYPYLAGRHHGWPLNTPIVLDETGVDGGIFERNTGWGYQLYGIPHSEYAEMLRWCYEHLDSRVVAQCPYGLDFQNGEWWSFNYVDALPFIETWVAHAASAPDNTVHIPVVVVDTPEPVPVPDETPPAAAGIVDPLVAEAIMQVESGGAGFTPSGRLKVRVEAHLLLNPNYGNPPAFVGRFRFNEQNPLQAWYLAESGQWIEYHAAGQPGEWAALELALGIDRDAALRCTSMGASQVMGFNHAMIGYATVEAMFVAFTRSEGVHVLGLLNYCLAKPGLVQAMRVRDWPTVGRLYNGAASAGELYRQAYKALA